MFSCNLPPALLAEWLGSFSCATAVKKKQNRFWWRITFSDPCACGGCVFQFDSAGWNVNRAEHGFQQDHISHPWHWSFPEASFSGFEVRGYRLRSYTFFFLKRHHVLWGLNVLAVCSAFFFFLNNDEHDVHFCSLVSTDWMLIAIKKSQNR